MAYKMTASLISAYQWYKDCPASWKDRALDSLKNTLTQGFTGTVATARGEKFEALVNSQLNNGTKYFGVASPLNFLRGMKQQEWLNPLYIDIDAHNQFIFRGRMDYIGEGAKTTRQQNKDLYKFSGMRCICDLKTTMGAIKKERYENSVQHIVYMLAMNIPHFFYFVAQFPTESGLDPDDLQVFHLERQDDALDVLTEKVAGLVKVLKDFNLWKTYCDVYCGGKK